MGQAVVESAFDDLSHHGVQADGRGDDVGGAGMVGGGSGGEFGDVLRPVLAGRKEVRAHHDAGGSPLDTPGERGGDGRLCELHVGGLDEGKGLFVGKALDEGFEHFVGRGAAGTVIDDDDADGVVGIGWNWG